MGNNNSMITVMFEEIKALLVSIENRLDRGSSKSTKSNSDIEQQSSNQKAKVEIQKLDQILKSMFAYLQNSDHKITQANQTIGDSEKRILSQIQEIKHSIENQYQKRIIWHHHVVDLKSSKVVVTIGVLVVLLLASFFGNLKQSETNSRMSDNDLKYRYVKSQNGISAEKLKRLEKAFQYPRNKKIINAIKTEVEDIKKQN